MIANHRPDRADHLPAKIRILPGKESLLLALLQALGGDPAVGLKKAYDV